MPIHIYTSTHLQGKIHIYRVKNDRELLLSEVFSILYESTAVINYLSTLGFPLTLLVDLDRI